ncbi:hypothetical protein D3C78_1943880 [compost metagenome]
MDFIRSGSVREPRRTMAAASSIRSMALSGMKRSEMYLSASSTAATRASSHILTRWWAS